MRVILCALTGMGNHIFESLRTWSRLRALLVITRREPGPFPHYPCDQLDALCAGQGVACRTDLCLDSCEGRGVVEGFKPDVLLSATFHQRIPAWALAPFTPLALNIHPSLLPGYRGPTPTNWAILRGEPETGVSFHKLVKEMDAGDLYAQRRLPIGGRTDGELRLALAELAASAVCGILEEIVDGRLAAVPQDTSKSTWQPKVDSEAGFAILRQQRLSQERLKRGLTPMPGPKFLERIVRERDAPE